MRKGENFGLANINKTRILPFSAIDYDKQVSNIGTIGIRDSVFVMSINDYHISGQENTTDAYLVVDVAHKKNNIFTDQKSYKGYLKNLGIDSIKMYDADSVFYNLEKINKLPQEWEKYYKPTVVGEDH